MAYLIDQINTVLINPELNWDIYNNSDHRAIQITMYLGAEVLNRVPKIPINKIKMVGDSPNQRSNLIKWTNKEHQKIYIKRLEDGLRNSDMLGKIQQLNRGNKENLETLVNELHVVIIEAKNSTNSVLKKPDIIQKHLPIKNKRDNKQNRPPWNDEIKEVYQLKSKFNKLWLETREYHYRQKFNFYRSKLRRLEKEAIRKSTDEKAKQLTHDRKTNMPKMWKNVKFGMDEQIAANIDTEKLVSEYSEIFNKKAMQIDTMKEEEMDNSNKAYLNEITKNAGSVRIPIAKIKNIIKRLKNNKSPGNSTVSNEMIKYGGTVLAVIITQLLTTMINFSYIPPLLSIGIIFPIVKDKRKPNTDLDNTRPITLSDTLAIIMEKYMLSSLDHEHAESGQQFGFKSESSTNHAIYALREVMLKYKQMNKQLYICFMDFSKAFDKVNRVILFNKLTSLLDPHHWAALYMYYQNSTIRIRNKATLTHPIKTTIGVKQGGPLSPKLFSVYIDELIHKLDTKTNGCKVYGINVNSILYADDTTLIYPTIKELQRAIDILVEYCDEHEIQINIKKTKCMTTRTKRAAESTHIKGEELEYVDKFRYLGWWLESNLANKEHIKTRKMAAIVTSYQLRRIGFDSASMSPEMKTMLRETYCRSKLRYGFENTFMTEKSYKEIETVDCKIMKTALGLQKYHSNSLINSSMNSMSITNQIRQRKLKFVLQLAKYKYTNEILSQQIKNIHTLPMKSLMKEITSLTAMKENVISEEDLELKIRAKIKLIEEETIEANKSKSAEAIRYLLDRRRGQDIFIAGKLLWHENSIAKRREKQRRKTITPTQKQKQDNPLPS